MRYYSISLLVVVLCVFPRIALATITIKGTVLTNSNEHYFAYARYLRVPVESQNGDVWDAANDRAATELLADAKLCQIYDSMFAATRTFAFSGDTIADAIQAAQEQFTLRSEATSKLNDMNTRKFFWYTNDKPQAVNWVYKSEWDGYRKVQTPFLHQKANTNADEAIEEVCDGQTEFRGECYGAIVICIWWGQYMALGADRFNAKWPATTIANGLSVGRVQTNSTYAAKLITRETNASDQGVPGDWFYMRNYNYIDVYEKFKGNKVLLPSSRYFWQGENVFYTGTAAGVKKFEGLGTLPPGSNDEGPVTEAQLRTQMRNKYNSHFANIIAWNNNHPANQQLRVNGQVVLALEDKPADNAKLFWQAYDRIHNPP